MALSEAKRQKIEQAKSSPYVRAALDMIAAAEGTANRENQGYNVLFGNNRTFTDYSTHPNNSAQFQNLQGKTQQSTAAGRYQIVKRTYDGLARQLGKSDFSPDTQDEMAILLMIEKGALDPILSGDISTGISKLGRVWASLPSSAFKSEQPSRSDEFVQTAYVNALQQYANGAEVVMPTFASAQPVSPDGYQVQQSIPSPPTVRGGTARQGIVRYGQRITPEFQQEVERILYSDGTQPILPVEQYPPGVEPVGPVLVSPAPGQPPVQLADLPAYETISSQPFTDIFTADALPFREPEIIEPTAEERAIAYLSSQLDKTNGRMNDDFLGLEALSRPYADELLARIQSTQVQPVR